MSNDADVVHGSQSKIADPTPAVFAVFAFTLAIYGVRFIGINPMTVSAGPATVALNYAVLAAAIANLIGGVLLFTRGSTYPGYVTLTFGAWLVGFYLVITAGAQKDFTPLAVSWYVLFLIVPVVILAVPAFCHRDVLLSGAFVALAVLLLFLGLGFHSVYTDVVNATVSKSEPNFGGAINMLKVSAWAAFVAAACVWGKCAFMAYDQLGIFKTPKALGGAAH